MSEEPKLFRLEDIKSQLNEEEIELLKRAMVIAEETGVPQRVSSIVIFPSGAMYNLNKSEEKESERE